MVDLRLIHLSDLHFASEGRTLDPVTAVDSVAEAILRDYESTAEFALLISGDVTTQGRPAGYIRAQQALELLRQRVNVSVVVVCPGNHDIEATEARAFLGFNRFAFDLTNDPDQQWNEHRQVCIARFGHYSFVLINSSFHGDHSSGRVPLKAVRHSLVQEQGRHNIVALHHSPISSSYSGGGLDDAYELLSLITEFSASALLHGHVHSDQALTIGEHTQMFGAGSLGFEPDPNMSNQFAIHDFASGNLLASRVYKYQLNRRRFERDGK